MTALYSSLIALWKSLNLGEAAPSDPRQCVCRIPGVSHGLPALPGAGEGGCGSTPQHPLHLYLHSQ